MVKNIYPSQPSSTRRQETQEKYGDLTLKNYTIDQKLFSGTGAFFFKFEPSGPTLKQPIGDSVFWILSVFSTVRHRSKRSKGCVSE